jgi:hypothetical protein
MVDAIEALARRALFTQHDISGVTILRVLFDFTATPANHEALARITRDYSDRIRFESECG